MKIHILTTFASVPPKGRSAVFLVKDNWNDWGRYKTQFHMRVFDGKGKLHEIGEVKIGQFSMAEGKPGDNLRPQLANTFESLDEDSFSVGQSAEYYSNLRELPGKMGEKILQSLNDIAINEELYFKAREVHVTIESLMRSVHLRNIEGQYKSILEGGAVLTRFNFTYKHPARDESLEDMEFTFKVIPDSKPPTNIHVLVGRNGVGKTYLLNTMTEALVRGKNNTSGAKFTSSNSFLEESGAPFDNLVSIAFSAFDNLKYIPNRKKNPNGVSYFGVGLRKRVKTASGEYVLTTRNPSELKKRFVQSVAKCVAEPYDQRWSRALRILESDPLFQERDITQLVELSNENLTNRAGEIWDTLSSGHKIVLLSISKLVELVEEQTLVLMDEPESHLHPPLLSAFIRAVSNLLVYRNGVAIIATHSPVVLQEVPKSCVWQMESAGEQITIFRPEIETFGENIGVLTRAIFGLEVLESGFHKMIKSATKKHDTKEGVLREFDDQLGSEGRALVNGLLLNKSIDS